ncbi:DUF4129 domain-containing protein [Isoptericola jiangsuensis]|uniref:DUF4129 domain-containing protein n=1 Tax=Isoptericola jiangsuensis TaxID=548579 RepID=UPI003AAB9094
MTSVHGAVLLDVPVEPDRDTARDWLVQELSRPEYSTDESLLLRLLRWIGDLLDGLSDVTVNTTPLLVVIVVAVVVVVALAWWLTGPVRLRRRGAAGSVVVHDDDPRTAAEMRAAADDAARAGDWALAVVERFRAVVRSLEERAVLDDRPGRTAREAADDAGLRLPGLAGALTESARTFDGVCYGHLPAGPEDDAALRALDDQVASTRPTAPATAGTA